MTTPGFPQAFPRIETERLILRGITHDDIHAIFRNFSDPEIAQWFLKDPYTEIAQASRIVDAFIHEFEQGQGITWAMTLRENGSCVGTCGYGDVKIADRGEIGFDLAKEQWGKGLMTESLTAIIDYGFEVLGLRQVEAHTYSDNARAKRLLAKLGFQLDTVSEDSHYFSLLKQDWVRPRPGDTGSVPQLPG